MVSTMENESITENIQPAKKQKTSNGSYKAPSAEELYNLKNTESLYQSNLFRLQVTFTKFNNCFCLLIINLFLMSIAHRIDQRNHSARAKNRHIFENNK
jgi:hypothetical protein